MTHMTAMKRLAPALAFALAAGAQAFAQSADPATPAPLGFSDAILFGAIVLIGVIAIGIEGRMRTRAETVVRSDLRLAQAENARLWRDLQKQERLVQELKAKPPARSPATPAPAAPAAAPAFRTAEEVLFAAAFVSLDEAARAVREGSIDPDLRALDEAIGLGADLTKAVALLESVRKNGLPALVAGLEQGGLDAALTSGPLVRAYYPAAAPWTRLAAALGAAEGALILALERAGVSVALEAPLSTLAAGAPEASPFGRTGLRGLAPIRDRAASAARNLPRDRALVVDCHAPGWRSKQGAQKPGVTVFDPASWV